MMNTLLESKPHRQRTAGGTIFSIVFHSALLFFAIYATARAGVAKDNEQREQKVRFIAMKKEPPPPPEVKKNEPPPPPPKVKKPPPVSEHNPPPLPPTPVEIAPPKGFKVLEAPVNVPVDLPKVDLSAKATNEDDFSGKGVKGGSGSGKEGGTGTNEGGTKVATDQPYMEFQVEKTVEAISGTHVAYPETLRSSGIEGTVQAQFVVNALGRVEPGTFKVLNSPNVGFVQAVKEALSGMRFSPARIGDQKVAQVVQQSFVFKIDKQ